MRSEKPEKMAYIHRCTKSPLPEDFAVGTHPRSPSVVAFPKPDFQAAFRPPFRFLNTYLSCKVAKSPTR